MNLQKKFSEEQFKELLIDIYIKGQEAKSIEMNEMMNEIKQKLMNVIEKPKHKVL
ncbi:hypothetical protein J7E71_21320 [Mesobacillus foraminis]|uniref:hypothetical protein n=1 Tax=Mesobacillus foraminis TaxID=279826 RepID=UPI001BE85E16|nr:hypothetical protein [Mesobacillus foraminis]MBT2758414.1 hypothetical protein [Mesobacillus foraminis]